MDRSAAHMVDVVLQMSYDPNQPRDDHGRWGEGGAKPIGQWTGGNPRKMSLESFDALTSQNLKAPLTSEEISSLSRYRNGGFEFNNKLRGDHPSTYSAYSNVDEDIARLDSAFKKASLREPVDVYRAIEKSFQQFMSGHDEFIDKGYLSTSLRPDVLRHFDSEMTPGERRGYATIKIAVPRGFPAIFLGPSATGLPLEYQSDRDWSDRETLLNRSTRLKRVGELAWRAVE